MVKDLLLYDRLEVPYDATNEQIKKNFYRLSKTWHPDKHLNEEDKINATNKFKELNEAKEILLDTEKRKLYDKIGLNILNNGLYEPNFNNFDNLFSTSFFNMNNNKTQNYDDINETLNVTLEQLYNEENINLSYKQKIVCPKCNGEGHSENVNPICNICTGKGTNIKIIKIGIIMQQIISQCHQCKGIGKIIQDIDKCIQCNGNCYIYKDKSIQIPLKSGLNNESKINLSNKGNQFKNIRTNLIICINELPHEIFKRHNDDLFITINLNLYQALFGFKIKIKHLDNRELIITTNDITEFNSIKKISNEGMKTLNSDSKGDLYIKFIISLPNISDDIHNIKNILKVICNEQDNDLSSNCTLTSINGKLEYINYLHSIFDNRNYII